MPVLDWERVMWRGGYGHCRRATDMYDVYSYAGVVPVCTSLFPSFLSFRIGAD